MYITCRGKFYEPTSAVAIKSIWPRTLLGIVSRVNDHALLDNDRTMKEPAENAKGVKALHMSRPMPATCNTFPLDTLSNAGPSGVAGAAISDIISSY